MIVLGRAALSGDVSAARECLAALGVNGTAARTNVLVNVESHEPRGLNFELLRHAHGIAESVMRDKVFPLLDSLQKEKPVIDSSYFPDESYCEGVPGMPDVESADSPHLLAQGLLEDPLMGDDK